LDQDDVTSIIYRVAQKSKLLILCGYVNEN